MRRMIERKVSPFVIIELVHSYKPKNDYENEQYKHLPLPPADQRSLREVFPQITFKEHIPRTRIGCTQKKQAIKEQ